MAINLSNFVDIKINYHLTTKSSGTRDTAVLIVGTNSGRKDTTVNSLKKYIGLEGRYAQKDLDSYPNSLYYYGYCFFSNGGKNLRIIERPFSTTEKMIPSQNTSTNGFLHNESENGILYIQGSKQSSNIATPQNANYNNNNEDPRLFEGTLYVQTQDEHVELGKTYYIVVTGTENLYAIVENPRDEDLPNYYELSTCAPTDDANFIEAKIYYTNNSGSLASPKTCGLYENKVETLTNLTSEDILDEVSKLGNEYVLITSEVTWTKMKDVNDTYNQEDKSISSKLFLTSITETEYTNNEAKTEAEKVLYTSARDGFILKYGRKGIEMSIAAYLTQINVNRFNSVKDYDFTIENVSYEYETSSSEESVVYSSVYEENSLVEALMKYNINVDSTLVEAVRNLGGNDTNGNDLVNEFMLIVLHQTLTDRLVQLLSQKIKYNQTGLSLIGATIASELQRYVDNGYLTTDKSWTDPDLVYEGITIIRQNTPLQIGYKYVIFPFSSLTTEERAEHKLPPIYILIADSYSIRKIEINGEVF